MASVSKSSPSRRIRRSPDEVRAAAVLAARRLLLEDGPAAITLKAVAGSLGMAHGNLTHHFGSVGALHSALAEAMAHELAEAVDEAVERLRGGQTDARQVVDLVFTAFDRGGSAKLIAWLHSTGQSDQLAPFYAAIAEVTGALSEGEAGQQAGGKGAIAERVAAVIIPALGAALIGKDVTAAIAQREDLPQKLITEQLMELRRHHRH